MNKFNRNTLCSHHFNRINISDGWLPSVEQRYRSFSKAMRAQGGKYSPGLNFLGTYFLNELPSVVTHGFFAHPILRVQQIERRTTIFPFDRNLKFEILSWYLTYFYKLKWTEGFFLLMFTTRENLRENLRENFKTGWNYRLGFLSNEIFGPKSSIKKNIFPLKRNFNG